MKLTDIKKNADAKAAEVESARKHAELIAELDVHPLLKSGCDRNVREAYFCGICFAAVSDEDNVVDQAERRVICRVGQSLSLLPEEIDELIAGVSKTVQDAIAAVNPETGEGGDRIFALLEDCADSLKEPNAFRLFVAEYAKVCTTKRLDDQGIKDVMAQLLEHVAAKCGFPVSQSDSGAINEDVFDALCRVTQSGREFKCEDLLKLVDWLDEDEVRYLMLDVLNDDVKPILDAHRNMWANRAALPEKLVKIIESDETWPVEFKPADYQPLFDAAGVAEADAGAFVGRELLPFMKRACESARGQLKKVQVVEEDDVWKLIGERYYGAKFEVVKEFKILFRYAFFLDAYLDLVKLSPNFYFCGPSEYDSNYYLVSGRSEDVSYARREKMRTQFGIPGYCKCTLDRLRCHWSIWKDEDEAEYFAQWDRLFADIENFISGNKAQDR